MNDRKANERTDSQATDAERRRPEGREGAGAQQQGRNAEQAGQTNRRADGDNQKHERAVRLEGGNDHQKTVSGKNQHGPEAKIGKTAGGNEGSKRQNLRDEGDEVGRGGQSVGSHKPGGDGPGTKKFKHDHDPAQPKDRSERG